jgi:DNA-binding transcriptional regulator YiaG
MDVRTSDNQRNGTLWAPVAFTMLLGVGTGGEYTYKYHTARSERAVFYKDRGNINSNPVGVAAADIQYIKSSLCLTISELASSLGISRQTVYNWIDGTPIKNENAAKLNNLKAAADVIVAAGVQASPLLIQRKLPGGKTLLESILDGDNGRQAAEALVQLHRKETAQREMLSKLFANRTAASMLSRPAVPPLADEI